MNEEKGKISLGLKQTTPEPWSVIEEKYQVGQVVTGKVVQIKEYGAFVELEPGLDGLVHISQISRKFLRHPSEVLQVGDIVTVWVMSVDLPRKRIAARCSHKLPTIVLPRHRIQDEPPCDPMDLPLQEFSKIRRTVQRLSAPV